MSLFPPPQQIDAEVFAEVPAALRRPERTVWADTNRGGQRLHSFLEGPSFDREGNLYVVDIPHTGASSACRPRAPSTWSPNTMANPTG